MSILDEALRYRGLGLSVIPIPKGAKQAETRWKCYQQKVASTRMLERWFSTNQQNVAVVCGAVSSGLTVRDFDSHESYRRWAIEYPEFAKSLPTVSTARGLHVWARTSRVPKFRQFSDGELRTDKHYVVAPPSIHPAGSRYSWAVPLGNEIPVVCAAQSGFLLDFGKCNTEDTEDTGCAENADNSETQTTQENSETQDVRGRGIDFDSEKVNEDIRQAIERTTVDSPKTRHRRLFDLARELKAIPELRHVAAGCLKIVVQRWHQRSLPKISTEPFEVSWFEFIDAWENVKYAAGDGPLYAALNAARRSATPSCAVQYEDNEQLVLLVKLCRELQRLSHNSPFFLECRKAGELIGTDHVRAWRYLRGLAKESPPILKIVSVGSRSTGKATDYLYLGD